MNAVLRSGFWWPEDDLHSWKLAPKEVHGIERALPYVLKRDLVVQAGGNVGIWPAWLAERFAKVVTFEPSPDNYEGLVKNVPANVEHHLAGLGAEAGSLSLVKWPDSCARTYISPDMKDEGVPIVTIDSLNLPACDLIVLDIEGFELFALQGAAKTIEKFNPVIMFEENGLSVQLYGCQPASEYLTSLGYETKGRVHRQDLIMVRG